MAEYAPAAIQGLFDQIHAAIPTAVLSGIIGDQAHTYGYHRGRDYVPPSDYSAQLAEDLQGDGQAACGLDLSWTDAASHYAVSARLLAAAGDPRMAACREFYGSVDGWTVCGWDYAGDYAVTSTDDHLWHVHISLLRYGANDAAALALIGDVITGGTTSGDNDMTPDEHQMLVNCQNGIQALMAWLDFNPQSTGPLGGAIARTDADTDVILEQTTLILERLDPAD